MGNFFKTIILILTSFIITNNFAYGCKIIAKQVEYVENYNGGSFFFKTIEKKRKTFRRRKNKNALILIRGIEVPNINAKRSCERKQGLKAQQRLKNLLKDQEITLTNCSRRQKYSRIFADVKIGKTDVAEILIKEG